MLQETHSAEEGWRQVRAGVSLVAWSRLAHFDAAQLAFAATAEEGFEFGTGGHRELHKEFGRLICWISFSVGGEYLAKGVCLLKGQKLTVSVPVIRGPTWNEDIDAWSALVNANHPSIKVQDVGLGTLGTVPIGSIGLPGASAAMVSAAMRFLASTIRNRDAHRYEPNVRAAHFQAVPRLFVPAFNALLKCLDQDELRHRLSGAGTEDG